jgi:YegS/Rv2252/BmrU family lipid kinase
MQSKRCLFVINPISGLGKQKNLPDLIHKYLDKKRFSYEIKITQHAGHAYELVNEQYKHFDVIVAAGGDGTVNEVAAGLIHKSTALGVIPLGSGNGFARHFGIALQASRAIQQLNHSHVQAMDTGHLNQKPFFNVSGIGFDGQISKTFAEQNTRGYITYARCVVEELQTYRPKKFSYVLDGREVEGTYFLIAFANTSQYGNNAVIAPQADTQDGLLDMVIVKPFPPLYLPAFTMMSLFRALHHSPYVEIVRTDSVLLHNLEEAPVHIDGEFISLDRQIKVGLERASLQVMVPIK